MWQSKKNSMEFLAYMAHKGWRARIPPVGSCCLYFLKHPEINSMAKCPWRNKVESERPGALAIQEAALDSACWPLAVLLIITSLSRAVLLNSGIFSFQDGASAVHILPFRNKNDSPRGGDPRLRWFRTHTSKAAKIPLRTEETASCAHWL